MKKILLAFFLITLSSLSFSAPLSGKYELKTSKINYLVEYLIKKADGESLGAKGKGECKEACEFLVAAPVKSFESKDSNRDANMLSLLKADQHPLIVTKIKTGNDIKKGELVADIEINFSGVVSNYKNIVFKIVEKADGLSAEGKFDLLLDNHKIERPSLLGVRIENLVPITITAEWKKI